VEIKPTVFLVDDDPAVRDAVSLFLELKGRSVELFDSAQAFLDAYDPDRPGCLVLDIRMPGMSGLELQDLLLEKQLGIPIIFISGHGDVPVAVKAFKAGAVDFLEKPFDNHRLLACIDKAISNDTERRQRQRQRSDMLERYQQLTPREQQVMVLVAEGNTNKDIARRLDISHRTVEIHRRRVMEKLGANSVSDLVSVSVLCGVYDLHSAPVTAEMTES